MLNNKTTDLPMYTPTKVSRPEDIEPPLYEVSMKNTREKNKRNMIN